MFRLSIIADRGIFASDERWLNAVDEIASAVRDCPEASLQVRVKDRAPAERTRLIVDAATRLGSRTERAILNGAAEEAHTYGFGGAHLPEAEIPAAAPMDRPALVGASVHSVAALQRALAARVDYVQFGPVFDAGSKPAAGVGLRALAEFAAASPLPVVAVGGITPENTQACLQAGAAAVAAVTGVLRSPNRGAAIDAYLAAFPAAAIEPARA